VLLLVAVAILSTGCNKDAGKTAGGAVTCKKMDVSSDGMKVAWKGCSDGKAYEIVCSPGEPPLFCDCMIGGKSIDKAFNDDKPFSKLTKEAQLEWVKTSCEWDFTY
jgi:hypothetical protein